MKRIVGLLGWLGIVLVLAAVALRFLRPELQGWSQGLALGGLVAAGLYTLSQWREIGRSFQGRHVRYGSMAAGSIAVFLAIIVAVNWISSRRNVRWDLTGAQQFSLSDQTRQVLAGLEKPVTVRVFHEPGNAGSYRDRLGEYEYVSRQLKVEYIDAERQPTEARQHDVQMLPTILFEYEGRTERTTRVDEQDLTNALKKVIEGRAKKIYFIQGHGEHDTGNADRNGYATVARALETDNFEVAKLTLAQEGRVPDDATVVVAAGPKVDYLEAEVEALRTFLGRGGKVMLLLDPPDKADAPALTGLVALAKEWNIEVGRNIVVDASGLGQIIGADASVPIAMPRPGHPIVERFNLMTAFPLTRSVTPGEGGTDGRYAQTLLETSPQSWAESDISALYTTRRPERNLDKGDTAGPVAIAAAVSAPAAGAPEPASPELPKPDARVVVVGDSDFAANGAINIQGNRDLFLNMANWLAQQENLIAIRARDPEDRRISLTADQSDRIFWFAIVIVPGLLLANGVRVWWKRR